MYTDLAYLASITYYLMISESSLLPNTHLVSSHLRSLHCNSFLPRLHHLSLIKSSGSDVLEPIRPTVLALQPGLAGVELARFAAPTLGAVGTVVERYVVVADVLEPRERICRLVAHTVFFGGRGLAGVQEM